MRNYNTDPEYVLFSPDRSRKVDPLRVEERDRSMRVINKLDQLEIKIDNHVTKVVDLFIYIYIYVVYFSYQLAVH